MAASSRSFQFQLHSRTFLRVYNFTRTAGNVEVAQRNLFRPLKIVTGRFHSDVCFIVSRIFANRGWFQRASFVIAKLATN